MLSCLKTKMIKSLKQKNKGFTLVETLVAISIFSLSIIATMSVLGSGISDTGYAKKKMIAGNLAQEGIEYVRNMRDTSVLYHPGGSQAGWNAFMGQMAPCDITNNPSKACYFDDQISLTDCGGSCPTLLYDSSTGKYNYSSGQDSGYIRKIQIIDVNGTQDEKRVLSTVIWPQGSGIHTIVFSENIFNWTEL